MFQPAGDGRTYPHARDIWEINTPLDNYSIAGPDTNFWSRINGLIEAYVFVGYDAVGYDECQWLLTRNAIRWSELFEVQARN